MRLTNRYVANFGFKEWVDTTGEALNRFDTRLGATVLSPFVKIEKIHPEVARNVGFITKAVGGIGLAYGARTAYTKLTGKEPSLSKTFTNPSNQQTP